MVYAPYRSYIVCLLSSGVESISLVKKRSWVRIPQGAPFARHSGYKKSRSSREVSRVAFLLFWRGFCEARMLGRQRPDLRASLSPRECLRELRQSGQGRLRLRLPPNGLTPYQKVYSVWMRPMRELESNVKALSLQIVTTSMYSYSYGQQDSTCGGNPGPPVGTGVFSNQPERYHAPIRCWSGQHVPPLH